jgi:hypothetical protein
MEKINSVKTYTISDALDVLNDSLLTNKKKEIGLEHFYNLIYNKVKPNLIRKRDGGVTNGKRVLINHNEVVKVYDHIISSNKKRYSTNGRKKLAA